MRIIIRYCVFLLIVMCGLIIVTKCLSPHLSYRIGMISGSGASDYDDRFSMVYLDVDTGIIAQEAFEPFILVPLLAPDIIYIFWHESDQAMYYLAVPNVAKIEFGRQIHHTAEIIASYERLHVVGAFWHEALKQLFFVHSSRFTGTVLYSVDITTGDLSVVASLPDFVSSAINVSPDQNYVLVNPQQDADAPAIGTHSMRLIDVRSGTVKQLDDIAFAYWSPDSQKIAIGYETEIKFEVDVSVYDVSSDSSQSLGVIATQEGIPIFQNEAFVGGILWSPDSQALALLNIHAPEVVIARLSGENDTFQDVQLKPQSWSPNGRYVLTIGYGDQLTYGIFILDTHTGESYQLQSYGGIHEGNNFLEWSADSRHIAYFNTLIGRIPTVRITIFDHHGQVVRKDILLSTRDAVRLFPAGISWWNGD